MRRFLLIPLAHSVLALQAYLDIQPDDGRARTADELRRLAGLATHVIETSDLLVRYAVALAGKPAPN